MKPAIAMDDQWCPVRYMGSNKQMQAARLECVAVMETEAPSTAGRRVLQRAVPSALHVGVA